VILGNGRLRAKREILGVQPSSSYLESHPIREEFFIGSYSLHPLWSPNRCFIQHCSSSLAVPIGGELKAFRPFFRFTCQYLCSRSACFRCKSAKKRNCNINCVLCDKQRRNDINSGVWCVHLQIGFLTFALEEKIQRD
jgi:hypothetical protein